LPSSDIQGLAVIDEECVDMIRAVRKYWLPKPKNYDVSEVGRFRPKLNAVTLVNDAS